MAGRLARDTCRRWWEAIAKLDVTGIGLDFARERVWPVASTPDSV
jgi:hypothetical protein